MSNPFKVFRVEPAYGSFRAVIDLQLDTGLSGDVYIYRSTNGATGWKLVNAGAPIQLSAGEFNTFADQDTEGVFNELPYYRGVLDPGGPPETWIAGPAVAAFAHLNKRVSSRIKAVLKREYRRISGRKSDGMTAFHLIPIEDGETVTRYDSETGQLLGPSCLDNPNDQGFGSPYVGGFYPPMQTRIRMLKAGSITDKSNAEATRQDQNADIIIRFLAHPRPATGHMIALPVSDRRYVVGTEIMPFYFPGTNIPVAWEAQAKLLHPKDERMDVPIPLPIDEFGGSSSNVMADDGELLGDGGLPTEG